MNKLNYIVLLLVACAAVLFLTVAEESKSSNTELRHAPPSWESPLGNDHLGRANLNRLVWGTKISIEMALKSIAFSVALGLTGGLTLFFLHSKKIGVLMEKLVDAWATLPFFPILIAFVAIFRLSYESYWIVLGLLLWAPQARLIAAGLTEASTKLYSLNFRSFGLSRSKILFYFQLPEAVAPALRQALIFIPDILAADLFFQFVGLGASPPTPTIGGLLKEGWADLALAPHQFLSTVGVVVMIAALCHYANSRLKSVTS